MSTQDSTAAPADSPFNYYEWRHAYRSGRVSREAFTAAMRSEGAQLRRAQIETQWDYLEPALEAARLWTPKRVAAAQSARYRANKRGALVNDLTSVQWEHIKQRWHYRCAYCGCTPARLTQDHVIPLSRGGNHTAANIVPACQPCNSSKHDGPAPPFVITPDPE